MKKFHCAILLLLIIQPAMAQDLPIGLIKLPPGFKIEVYASDLPGARSMIQSPAGTLFIGTREQGNVYALTDENSDGKPDKTYLIAQGLNMPNGVAFKDGALYVAEIHRIIRFDDIEKNLDHPPAPVVVYDKLPQDKSHGWKYLAFGPDGWLYFGIGAPCNVCDKRDPYSSIYRIKPDGSQGEVFARGVRNTVGFDWHPGTKDLWFTDNGRDMLGDDFPPDELNFIPSNAKVLNFGFPFCHGLQVPDPEIGEGHDCQATRAPAQTLGAHVAALGMKFYNGAMFPNEYSGQIFIAEHGSWNRSAKNGYRIMRVKLDSNTAVNYEVFAEGWLHHGRVWGRPVDVLILPDGSMLVSDDHAGVIYRIAYTQ